MKKLLLAATAAALMTPVSAFAERDGSTVYNTYCLACHMSGIAGAPKVGDASTWEGRTEKGIDGLLATAKSGLNVMPPKGNCQDCSDTELTAAIQHMLDNTK